MTCLSIKKHTPTNLNPSPNTIMQSIELLAVQVGEFCACAIIASVCFKAAYKAHKRKVQNKEREIKKLV